MTAQFIVLNYIHNREQFRQLLATATEPQIRSLIPSYLKSLLPILRKMPPIAPIFLHKLQFAQLKHR